MAQDDPTATDVHDSLTHLLSICDHFGLEATSHLIERARVMAKIEMDGGHTVAQKRPPSG